METVMDKLGLQLWLYILCKIPKSKKALCNTSPWHKVEEQIKIFVCQVEPEKTFI